MSIRIAAGCVDGPVPQEDLAAHLRPAGAGRCDCVSGQAAPAPDPLAREQLDETLHQGLCAPESHRPAYAQLDAVSTGLHQSDARYRPGIYNYHLVRTAERTYCDAPQNRVQAQVKRRSNPALPTRLRVEGSSRAGPARRHGEHAREVSCSRVPVGACGCWEACGGFAEASSGFIYQTPPMPPPVMRKPVDFDQTKRMIKTSV